MQGPVQTYSLIYTILSSNFYFQAVSYSSTQNIFNILDIFLLVSLSLHSHFLVQISLFNWIVNTRPIPGLLRSLRNPSIKTTYILYSVLEKLRTKNTIVKLMTEFLFLVLRWAKLKDAFYSQRPMDISNELQTRLIHPVTVNPRPQSPTPHGNMVQVRIQVGKRGTSNSGGRGEGESPGRSKRRVYIPIY